MKNRKVVKEHFPKASKDSYHSIAIRKRPYLQHYIIELFNVDKDCLINLRRLAVRFVSKANLRVVAQTWYQFGKEGYTLLFILSSSHVAFHSWPEKRYLHIDLLACQKLNHPTSFIRLAKNLFKPCGYVLRKVSYRDSPSKQRI